MLTSKQWPSWNQVLERAYWGAEGEGETDPPKDPPADPPVDPKPDPEPEPTTFDAKYVGGLREESASHRVKAKEEKARADKAEAELAKIRKGEMSEIEAATTTAQEATERADKAEADYRNATLTLAVVTAANKLGFKDPADAQALLVLDDIEFDDDGAPVAKSIVKQLEKLAKAKAYLLGETDPGSGDGAGKTPKKPADAQTAATEKYAKELKDKGYLTMPTR